MGKRKVKKGRFLNETQAEKNLKAKLDPKVNALRDRLDAELMKTINEKEMERVSTQQGIETADREARIGAQMDSSLAKNIALPAQLASNAVADLTTGRRMGTAAEVQTDIDAAKAVSGKENVEDKGELRKTGQLANIDLTEAMAKERGDQAKRGALYNTVGGFVKGRLSAAGKTLTGDPGFTIDSSGADVPVAPPTMLSALLNPNPGGSNFVDLNYSPKTKSIESIQDADSRLSFRGPSA